MRRMSQSYDHDVTIDRHSMLITFEMLPVLSREDADDVIPVELRSRLPGPGGGLSAATCDAAATS